jgi:hypothetical protein
VKGLHAEVKTVRLAYCVSLGVFFGGLFGLLLLLAGCIYQAVSA